MMTDDAASNGAENAVMAGIVPGDFADGDAPAACAALAVLVIIFVLLYLNFGRLTETLIVMLSVPFALVGGVWLMVWMHFT